jgi:radical SAM protein with 4Fe4S-binding SPASM domain
MTPVLTTSGLGLSEARVQKLRAFAQVNVSYDGPAGTYDRVRGFDGASAAERAIERLAAAGIRVGVNIVLTRESFPHLRETIVRAQTLGACEAQLLRYKPAGRAASIDYFARRLRPEQARLLGEVLRGLSRDLCQGGDFHLRIDCALVPFLSADERIAADAAGLQRLGVFGCEAGGSLAAVTVDGRVAPCSFAPPTELAGVDLAHAGEDPELESWRRHVESPPEPCASCSIRPVCKGGCKVVARFVAREHGPDPECPRVLDYRRA